VQSWSHVRTESQLEETTKQSAFFATLPDVLGGIAEQVNYSSQIDNYLKRRTSQKRSPPIPFEPILNILPNQFNQIRSEIPVIHLTDLENSESLIPRSTVVRDPEPLRPVYIHVTYFPKI
jgi:hypothetical protein